MAQPPRGRGAITTPEQDATLLNAFVAFLHSTKTLTAPIGWRPDNNGNFSFRRTLDIDGLTEQGFVLFGRASPKLPDRNVTLGLRWDDPGSRSWHFDRLDWRPMDAHNNKDLGPEDFRFVLIEGTHHHRLADNAVHPSGLGFAMQENLPIAIPIEPEPSWQDFLAFAAQRWRINELVRTPLPPWEYDLFNRAGSADKNQ